MLIITIQVDAPLGQAIGIKEDLAMHCERFGDAKVIKVEEMAPEQLRLGDGHAREQPKRRNSR